jgi:glycosyltransferase involved in cell wall biosynthesis
MKSLVLKKVLILTEHFAPAYNAGGIVRSLENLVVNLKSRFIFFVLTSNCDLNKKELPDGVEYNSWKPFTPGTMVYYASHRMRRFSTIKRAIQVICPDIIYINGLYSPFFTLMPLWLSKKNNCKLNIVVAPCGMLHPGALSIRPLKKKIYFWFFKLAGFSRNLKWHATNEGEKNDIFRIFGKKCQVVIADVIPDSKPIPFQPLARTNETFRLITVSLITLKKGHLRVLKALNELQQEIQAEYHIFGPVKDGLYWRTCLQEIESIRGSVKVFYHGFLDPADLQSSLQKCHVFILHSDGENFCQAIFESLKAGRPVIASDQTPWNDLKISRAGWNVGLNDFSCLKNTIKEAYSLTQADFDELCKGAKERAERFIAESEFEKQYDLLFRDNSIISI